MPRALLTGTELEQKVASLEGWSVKDGHLDKTFTFADFVSAFGFMAKVAIEAEKLNHHPNWDNVYNRVHVNLWTHDAGGITETDITLAGAMNKHAG